VLGTCVPEVVLRRPQAIPVGGRLHPTRVDRHQVLPDPPSGEVERPRRVVGFARLIQLSGRDLGEPAVCAACGGNPSLTWLPLRVVRMSACWTNCRTR
jgi:hypothetical protein